MHIHVIRTTCKYVLETKQLWIIEYSMDRGDNLDRMVRNNFFESDI